MLELNRQGDLEIYNICFQKIVFLGGHNIMFKLVTDHCGSRLAEKLVSENDEREFQFILFKRINRCFKLLYDPY